MGNKAEASGKLERSVGSGTERGVPASSLGDEELRRELRRLHETREETFLNGTAHALEEHTRRMLELEHEYTMRFPREVTPDERRTSAGEETIRQEERQAAAREAVAPRAADPEDGRAGEDR